MKTVYVRWLGAFAGHHYSLKDSISYEIGRKDEAACEPLARRNKAMHSGVAGYGQVGLILANSAIFREFRKDTWSFYGQDRNKSGRAKKDQDPSRLYAGKMNPCSDHAEAWAHMGSAVTAIVVYCGIDELRQDKRNAVLNAAKKYSLPLYKLTRKGELIREEV